MARTVVDLDDDALARAQQVLGTGSKVATVNEALRRVAEEGERREALLRELGRGDLYAQLRDPDWR